MVTQGSWPRQRLSFGCFFFFKDFTVRKLSVWRSRLWYSELPQSSIFLPAVIGSCNMEVVSCRSWDRSDALKMQRCIRLLASSCSCADLLVACESLSPVLYLSSCYFIVIVIIVSQQTCWNEDHLTSPKKLAETRTTWPNTCRRYNVALLSICGLAAFQRWRTQAWRSLWSSASHIQPSLSGI